MDLTDFLLPWGLAYTGSCSHSGAMTDGRITTKVAAQRLNLSVERVRQLARSGRLPCQETGLGRLFDPADVEAFARGREHPDDPAAAKESTPSVR